MLYFRLLFNRLSFYFLLFFFSISFSFFFMETLTHYLQTLALKDLPLYYAAISIRDSDMIVSLSYLLALIASIQSLQHNLEIETLQMAGLKPRALLLPFYLFALLLTSFSYFAMEVLNPKLSPWIQKKSGHYKVKPNPFEVKILEDGSCIAFQRKGDKVLDLFWVRKDETIWHAKEVVFEERGASCLFVDLLKHKKGKLELITSTPKEPLPFDLWQAKPPLHMGDETPLLLLLKELKKRDRLFSPDRAKLQTLLSYKLLYPWFPHLFATAFLPSLFLFQRNRRPYSQYLLALFTFLLFFSFITTSSRLAENYIISPYLVLFGAPILLQTLLTLRMWKKLPWTP
jgi:lipopolysaccharide export LptBFGC system permease protein LptF